MSHPDISSPSTSKGNGDPVLGVLFFFVIAMFFIMSLPERPAVPHSEEPSIVKSQFDVLDLMGFYIGYHSALNTFDVDEEERDAFVQGALEAIQGLPESLEAQSVKPDLFKTYFSERRKGGQGNFEKVPAAPGGIFEAWGYHLVRLDSSLYALCPPEPDLERLEKGLRRGLVSTEPPQDKEAAMQAIQAFHLAREREIQLEQEEEARRNLPQSEAFLAQIAERGDIFKTERGTCIRFEKKGEGETPGPADLVRVYYHGVLADGTVFDSSRERGVSTVLTLDRVLEGVADGLCHMRVGGKATFYVPPALGYGNHPQHTGVIPPGAALIFEVELLEILPPQEAVQSGLLQPEQVGEEGRQTANSPL